MNTKSKLVAAVLAVLSTIAAASAVSAGQAPSPPEVPANLEVPAGHRAAAEWAHDQLGDDELAWLRRLPAERRLWADDQLVLIDARRGDVVTTISRVTAVDRIICDNRG